MKYLYSFLLVLSFSAQSGEVLSTFTPGDPIIASDINSNFQFITEKIQSIETKLNQEGKTFTGGESVVVGLSDPAVFGDVPFNVGSMMCHNKYSGSHICSKKELKGATFIPQFDSTIPLAIYADHPINQGRHICDDFKNMTSGGVSIAVLNNNGDIVNFSEYQTDFTLGHQYARDFLLQIGSNTVGSYNYFYTHSWGAIDIEECSWNIPAICCQ